MAKNIGKIFEEDFANSAPKDWFCHRLKDSAQSYKKSKDTKFSWENPFDYFLYNGETLYCLELKTTCQKYMGFQENEDDESSKMIKWHQIKSLTEASEYQNIVAGFILNFRLNDDEQLTYFLDVRDFNKMKDSINKKSFTIMDAVLHGAKKISGFKKRTRWHWNLDEFFESYNN